MRKVADILRRKGNKVTTVASATRVFDALEIMAHQNIGSVVVVDQGEFKGIMTERDYSRKVVLKHKSSAECTVAEIMTEVSEFPVINLSDSVDDCMKIMSEQNIRYLPVIDEGTLAGIISINDVVTETILTQRETIEQLQNYIQS